MAFAAETGSVPALAWWLLAVNTVWSVIYDTEYAMVDRDDDLELGIKSTAILFGRFDVPIIAALMVVMLALLAFAGSSVGLLWPWYLGLAGCAVLFGRQLLLIRGREREPCFRAFLNNNWAGFSIFLGLLLHYLLAGAYSG
jgi:4-hydroxybenzoate polyprenyltransferase